MITVEARCDRGELYKLSVREREPIYSITSPTGGVIARSDHLTSFEERVPFDVLLALSIKMTKLLRPLVKCAGCGEVYSRIGFELLAELEDGPFDHGISVRTCRQCGTCVAAPRGHGPNGRGAHPSPVLAAVRPDETANPL